MLSRRVKLRSLFVPLCFLASPFAQTAREPDQVPALSIRVSTRLVILDAVVTDKQGRPVPGLQASDFMVAEKGKPQKISVFTPPTEAAAKPQAPALPPGVYSNRPEYRTSGSSPTVILLDAANTSLPDQSLARFQMVRWVLDEYRPGDRVAIFSLTNGLSVLSDFTDDPSVLLDVLRQFVEQKPPLTAAPAAPDAPALIGGAASQSAMLLTRQFANFHSAELQFVINHRADITISAMQSLVRILGGLPGRKNVIWLTSSFPFSLVPEEATGLDASGSRWTSAELGRIGGSGGFQNGLDPGQQRLYADKVRDIAARFANSQVAIYPVDVTGLDPRGSRDFQRQETMKEIADETGGQAFVNQNDIQRGVEMAFSDRAASYTLGYYPADKKWDGGYRKISVKVNRQGVEVRHRPGYFALDPATENQKKTERELGDALEDRISATQIAFDATVSRVEGGKTRCQFLIDGSSLTARDAGSGRQLDLDFAVVTFAPDGKILTNQRMKLAKVLALDTYEQLLKKGLTVHLDVDIPPGKNLAWLAVRDNYSGNIGTLQATLGQ